MMRRVILVVAATERELEGVPRERALACGIGPVEAAAATARALALAAPRAILHVGIAGARRGCGIAVPQLVVGSEAIYCDPRSRLVPARALPDGRLLAAVRAAVPAARVVPIGTSARVG